MIHKANPNTHYYDLLLNALILVTVVLPRLQNRAPDVVHNCNGMKLQREAVQFFQIL